MSDIVDGRLQWRPFNGSWLATAADDRSPSSGEDLVYRDQFGGLSVLNADRMESRVLMTNSAFVSGLQTGANERNCI